MSWNIKATALKNIPEHQLGVLIHLYQDEESSPCQNPDISFQQAEHCVDEQITDQTKP